MNPKKKQELEQEALETKKQLKKETKTATTAMKNKLFGSSYVAANNGQPQEVHWKDFSSKQKTKLILSWFMLIAAIVYVVIVAYSPTWWGDECILSYVFSSPTIKDSDPWIVQNAKPVFGTIFYVLAILGLSDLLRGIISFATRKASKKTITIAKLSNSALKYAAWLILIFVILGCWGVDTGTILASAGIIALIIGLGAQSLIADIIGGLSIVFEEQFEVGDTVVIDDFRGVVSEIGLTATRLVDAAGNQKIIKNNQITSVINLSHDLSIAVCDISVDYDEDLRKVRKILEDNLPAIGKSIPSIIGKPTYLGVNDFADSGIDIRIIAKTKEENKFGATRALNEAVYLLLQKEKVNIPFPQVVISQRHERYKKKNDEKE